MKNKRTKRSIFFDKINAERAKTENYVGELHLYCDSENCCAREVDVLVKEYCGLSVSKTPRCPICGEELKTHDVDGTA